MGKLDSTLSSTFLVTSIGSSHMQQSGVSLATNLEEAQTDSPFPYHNQATSGFPILSGSAVCLNSRRMPYRISFSFLFFSFYSCL